MNLRCVLTLILFIASGPAFARDEGPVDLLKELEKASAELAEAREKIADEKIPLSEDVHELEDKLLEARKEYETVKRQLDRRNLDMNNLRNEIKTREQEKSYLSSLLGEYIRNLETRLHISELRRYQDAIEKARLAPENSNLKPAEVFEEQVGMVLTSLKRLEELCGGVKFEGRAAGEDGLVKDGDFILFGPVAFFGSDDGNLAGIAEQRLGSLEPSVAPFANQGYAKHVLEFVRNGQGTLPLDGSLGNARKVEETRETVGEHIEKGGFMMYPIMAVAAVTMGYSLFKFFTLVFMWTRVPSPKRVDALIDAVSKGDGASADKIVATMRGPVGQMLKAGVGNRNEKKDFIEEVMFETMLETRHSMRGLIPFVAVSAAAAPLMGLLGTVLGIINTFKMLTVFGSGDVKQLSGGISEALITTEAGLILAIPSLSFHALLSWMTKGYTDKMEKLAVSFLAAIEKGQGGGRREEDHVERREQGTRTECDVT